MSSCSAFGCTNRPPKKIPGITFHRFPKDPKRREEWTRAVSRKDWTPSKYSVLCSVHFSPELFDRTSLSCVRLRENAVPSIFEAFPSYMKKVKKSRKCPKERTVPDLGKQDEISETPCTSSTNVEEEISENVASPTKLKLKRRLETLEVVNEKNCKKLKLLHQTKRRLKKKVESLNDIIKCLKEKKLMQDDSIDILNSVAECNQEFLLRQISAQKSSKLPKKYSPQLRAFALTLHYLSPRAYNYVRKTFNLSLPHKRTIGKWYQHINGEPGFTTESFKALEQRIKVSSSPLLFALVIDEMAIRQQTEFDGKCFHGYVYFGVEDDVLPVANSVLVFLVVFINDNWKLPIGYFLIKALDSDQRANLVKQSLILLHDVKATVVSLTFDGIASNLSMSKKLGCDISPASLKTTFTHPADPQKKIAIFPDACHMLKLFRNTLGEKKSVVDVDDKFIDWKYICALHELQESEGLHIANKLKNRHINFFTQKMKVSLAAQLLSDSVADAIEFCDKELKFSQFADSDATVKFIRVFNILFDILNSRSLYHEGYKKAISIGNMNDVAKVLTNCKIYISGLKTARKGPKLLTSRRKTGFLGVSYMHRFLSINQFVPLVQNVRGCLSLKSLLQFCFG